MHRLEAFAQRIHIAYFSMEIALHPDIPTYSGGLGVLAGDTARSCSDLELPVVFVTLASRAGFLRQRIDAGRQIEEPDQWDPAALTLPLPAMVAVPVEGRDVWIRPWLFLLTGGTAYQVPVILLDSDLDDNAEEDRRITDTLYGGDDGYRLKQEILLGIGGVRILRALGFEIHSYHLNEGHSALLTLDLLRRHPLDPDRLLPAECAFDVAEVRQQCIFTTHTPVEAGHDRFRYDLVQRILGEEFDVRQLKMLAGADDLNMTRLALNLSGYVNGVAGRHAETAQRMFPGYRVHAITNGVHPPTWASPGFARLYQTHFPKWQHEPEALVDAETLADADVWQAHQEAKGALIETCRELSGVTLAPDVPLIGFARRMTGYKRPDLLFSDLGRLTEIARKHPFQLVLAGKAHPRDGVGKELIERLHRHVSDLAGVVPCVFLPNYDMALARYLVSGSDIWLNTPLPPLEASGTSGMKAALNGVLNLSVLDGWWVEACREGRTGWAIGQGVASDGDARALYDKLEHAVLPLYYEDRSGWIAMMKQAIAKIAAYFNSQRMMRRYASEAYLR